MPAPAFPWDANGQSAAVVPVQATTQQAFLAATAASLTVDPGVYRFHTTAKVYIAADGEAGDAEASDMPFDAEQSGEPWHVVSGTIKIFGAGAGGTFSATRML